MSARIEDGRRLRVVVTIPADFPAGEWRGTVHVKSTDPVKPETAVQLVARVEGDLTVRPGSIAFGRVASERGKKLRFVVESRTGRPFVIRELRGDGVAWIDGLTARAAARHELVARLPVGVAPGTVAGGLLVVTDRPGESRLEIRYTGRVVR